MKCGWFSACTVDNGSISLAMEIVIRRGLASDLDCLDTKTPPLSIRALCKVPSARIIHGLFPSLLIVAGESVRNRYVREITWNGTYIE